MLTDQEIDDVLLSNITMRWRKVAMVVGLTMNQLDQTHGRDDLFFANRVMLLAQKGLIESQGDLTKIRYSEVRLPSQSWETKDFEEMSWHDVSVHGFRIIENEGNTGTSELVFDIDYILEWINETDGFSFVVAQSTLQFHEVFGLKFSLDYTSCSAGMCAFSIGRIEREQIDNPYGYVRFKWYIQINWPDGLIEFESSGFSQWLVGKPIRQNKQSLEPSRRIN